MSPVPVRYRTAGYRTKIKIPKSFFCLAADDDDDSANIFRRRENFFDGAKKFEKKLGRPDRFRQKIVEIGAILAIFEPLEVRKFRTPFFGEFGRSSQD